MNGIEVFGEPAGDPFFRGSEIFGVQRFFLAELLGIELDQGRALSNPVHHQRLGEIRFVAFVVPVAPIADHVDDHVLFKGCAVVRGQPGHVDQGFGAFPVNVEDRGHDHFGHIGGVAGGAGVFGKSGVPDLVVDDQMDGPPGAIAGKLAHVEHFGHHPLAGKGRISVDQQRQDPLMGVVPAKLLAGPGQPFDNRVDGFQVAGIADQVNADRFSRSGGPVGQIAVVVFDVSGAGELFRVVAAFEFTENIGVGLAEDVGLDVETAPVGHAEDDLLGAVGGALVDQGVEQRQEPVGPFQGKTGDGHVFLVEKVFESVGFDEFFQDSALIVFAQIRSVAACFHSILKPAAFFGVLQVHVLHADASAVGLPQGGDDCLERGALPVGEPVCEKVPAEVVQGQSECIQAQQGVFGGTGRQGVHAGQQVAHVPVSVL